MINQYDFGKRIKEFRTKLGLSQKELALKIGVSDQAVSKWENGTCLPDVYNLKLLGKALNTSVDSLLNFENTAEERVVETIKVGKAVFELVEKPETILAGKILYAKDFADIDSFYAAIDAVSDNEKQAAFGMLENAAVPICDINLSVNFRRSENTRAYGFVREVLSENQPEGVDVYKMPASLYVRACADKETARLLSKEQCETWELFAYISGFFIPAHGLKEADNGAQEMEVFDTSEHRSGCVYVPVIKSKIL